jgi:hypothetical protein
MIRIDPDKVTPLKGEQRLARLSAKIVRQTTFGIMLQGGMSLG